MREILFRGKRLDNGEWVEGFYAYIECDNRHVIITQDTYTEYGGLYYFTVDPNTVGQYTGRKDKNGKRVFEGDILRMFTIWANGFAEPVDVPVAVWFYENDQCCVLEEKQGIYYDDFGNYGRPEYYEVIGNVHDNPELMGVK